MMENNQRFDDGLRIRRQVMGEARVRSSLDDAEGSSFVLQRLTTEFAWGDVWARDGLDRRSRSIMTIGMLIALNRAAELKAHMIAGLNNGIAIDEIGEMVIQAAVYCGFPAALEAMRIFETLRLECQNYPKE